MNPACTARIQKEIAMFQRSAGDGVMLDPLDGKGKQQAFDSISRSRPQNIVHSPTDMQNLTAQITGPEDSPYTAGIFKVSLQVPPRYPFEPPRVRFITPIYHPNIDSDGRICLDTLKVQPQGTWSPSVNISTLLLTIRQDNLTPIAPPPKPPLIPAPNVFLQVADGSSQRG